MKTDFVQLIQDDAVRWRDLHQRVHETCRSRDKGPAALRAWEEACRQFHSYRSPLDPFVDHAYAERSYVDKDLIEFVVCFLEADPHVFRSGYLKQHLLTRIKRSKLSEPYKRRLRAVLVDVVNRRGTREFRYYCRLAAAIADDGLCTQLNAIAVGERSVRSSRARMMLAHIRQHRLSSR